MATRFHAKHQKRKRVAQRFRSNFLRLFSTQLFCDGETKQFSLRTVLTVTTGRLLTEPKGERDNGIGDLYDLLGWMTMDTPFTHQLGRFADECKPTLYRLFPELGLADACLPKLDEWLKVSPTCPQEGIKTWLAELNMLFPNRFMSSYAIPQIPIEHSTQNPVDELIGMVGRDKVIVVNS